MKVIYALLFIVCISQTIQAQLPNLDSGFGNSGIAAADFNGDWDVAMSSMVMPDGRIFIAGHTRSEPPSFDKPFALAMFLPNGQPDNTFGTSGKKLIQTNQNGVVNLRSPLLQPDGKIVIPGTLNVNNITRRMVIRILPNGNLDTDFGNNGFFVSNNDLSNIGEDLINAYLLPDGKIWGVGFTGITVPPDGNLRSRYSSFRLTPEGIIDTSYTKTTTFRLHGLATALGNDLAYSSCRTPDKGILIAGTSDRARGQIFLKLDSTGKVDSTFGNNGFTAQVPNYQVFTPTTIKPAKNGGYFLCAQARNLGAGQPANTAIYKLTTAGRYDSTFGINGIAITPYTGVFPSSPISVDVVEDAQDRIWVAHTGQYISGGPRTSSITRFLRNGTPDNTYGNQGYLSTLVGGNPRQVYLGTDGIPLLVGQGQLSGYTNSSDLVVLKVNPEPVSVAEFINTSCSLAPNAVQQGRLVQVNLANTKPCNIKIIPANGQKTFTFHFKEGREQILPTKSLASGIYQVQVAQDNNICRHKLVVW